MSRTNKKAERKLWKQVVKVVLLTYIVGQILVLAGIAFYPPAVAVGIILAGRGPDCPKIEAIQAFYRDWRNLSNQEETAAASKILEEDDDGFQLVDTPWGKFWEPIVGGSAVMAQISEMQAKYENNPNKPIHPGDIALDCGANVGISARQMLDFGAGLVVAIEPSPKNLEPLRRNLAKEIEEGRVIIYPKGVWDKDDVLELTENSETDAMDSFVIRDAPKGVVTVPVTTIDKLVAELKLDRVDFIKMDIEGAEKQALTGAKETLQRFQPRMEISVNHLPDDPKEIPELVQKIEPAYKYQCLLCGGEWGQWRVVSQILMFQ